MANARVSISGRLAVSGADRLADDPTMSLRDKLVELAWQRWLLQEKAAAAPKPGQKPSGTSR
jgi:hypothetical protein